MSLCSTIDTLAMAFLDDELAPEERRELELHLLACESCKHCVEGQRALDAEDREATRTQRRSVLAWVLPGTATFAAAAAIALFVFVRPPAQDVSNGGRVAHEAVRQQTRGMPLEVQGPNTGPWLRTHFAQVEPPQFREPGIALAGARLTSIGGHDAALVQYIVTIGQNQFTLNAIVMVGLRGDELSGGTAIRVGDRELHVHDADGIPVVTYVDEHNTGYTFAAERLAPQELLELVVSSDLIGRAQQGR
jgi:anti-sigma factor RsiW